MNYFTVLMAEDDPDDRFLMEQAFRELGICGNLLFVEDGEEMMHYLGRIGKYTDPFLSPRPALILLDLNMPKKDGRQALLEIMADPDLRKIPVVVWTTSNEVEDRMECEKTGASSFVTKQISYADLVNALRNIITEYVH